MDYFQVLATFCTTVVPGGAKSNQTYQPPELITSIPGYFLACYSLNPPKVPYWHYSVIDPYIGSSFLPQWTLREGSTTVWYSPHEIDLTSAFMTSYSSKIISYCEHPPFPYFLIFIFLSPPKAYSSVFRPSFPGPTPYLEYLSAPLRATKIP